MKGHCMVAKFRLAVAGAGMIGQRHIEMIRVNPKCVLSAIVDPSPGAVDYAKGLDVPLFGSLETLFANAKPDGIIIATPNALHVAQGLACIAAGVPALIEKPVAHSLEAGLELLAAAEASQVPMMVGHHRQHGSIMAKAVEVVQSGVLGKIVTIVGTTLFYKAESEGYFDPPFTWRREPGGGPVMINMIHEVGNMRALAGDIAEVHAFASNATRQFAVEDTVAITLRFASGAVGTFAVSDTAASDRNWEHTSGEDTVRFAAGHTSMDDCYYVSGTWGSLAVPTMRLTRYLKDEDRSWHKPLRKSTLPVDAIDPLAAQIENFCNVLSGSAQPRVTIRDGVKNLRVVDAILRSANSGQTVRVPG
jgi:predicted dehydrogenase